jgi:peptidoglycan/LPS O-acetylase OafA/YrhL
MGHSVTPRRETAGVRRAEPETHRSAWHQFLDRFSRRTSSGRFIPEVDAIRFFAIALVVAFHLDDYVGREAVGADLGAGGIDFAGRYLGNGNRGVQLFFVLSGFILALPFAGHFLAGRKRPSTRGYYLRRLTRLEPPYVVAMCGLAVAAVVIGTLGVGEAARHLAASLGYVHNLVFGAPSRINGVAWTLEVEVQFYLLAPLLARVFIIQSRLHRRGVLAAVVVVASALQNAFLGDGAGRAELSLLNFIQYFLLGFLFADVYLTDWLESPPRDSRVWDVVALVGWPALLFVDLTTDAGRWLLPPLLFVLFLATFRGRATSRVFRLHLLTTIGGMCYTIYLLHYPLTSMLARVTPGIDVGPYGAELLLQSAIVLPILLAVSAVFFLAVERPCMDPNWVGKLRRRLSKPGGEERVHRARGAADRNGA